MDDIVGRGANQVLIERSMVDCAQAQAVAHRWLAAFDVSEDVCGVQEAALLEAADRALRAVRGNNAGSEARLMQPETRLTHGVTALDRILQGHRRGLIDWTTELTWCDGHHLGGRVIRADVDGEDRLVPAGLRSNEVDERDLKLVCGTEGTVVRLVNRAGAVGVEKTVRENLVVVRRL